MASRNPPGCAPKSATSDAQPSAVGLTGPQRLLLTFLAESGELEACERVCHPNTAAALERRGLLTIEDGDGGFRPWFDCQITAAGLAAIHPAPQADSDKSRAEP